MNWRDPHRYEFILSDGSTFACKGYLGLYENEKVLEAHLRNSALKRIPDDFFTMTREAFQKSLQEIGQKPDKKEIESYPNQAVWHPLADLQASLTEMLVYWSRKYSEMQRDWTRMQEICGGNRTRISIEELEQKPIEKGLEPWLPDDWIISRHYEFRPSGGGFVYTGEDFAFLGFMQKDLDHLGSAVERFEALGAWLQGQQKPRLSVSLRRY